MNPSYLNLAYLLAILALTLGSCKQSSKSKISIGLMGELNGRNYVEANVHIDEVKKIKSRIKTRGGHSMIYPKPSYEIDLEKDLSLLNLPADDDWILNASYIDKTLIRHKLNYDLFLAMSKGNKASRSEYFELYLDTTYHGLYLLMEKLDVSTLNIDRDDSTAFIFKEPSLFREADYVTPQDSNNYYQQTFPELKVDDKKATLTNIRKLLISNQAESNSEIEKIFDLANVIDWHLLLLISNSNDGFLKNFYLYKRDFNTNIRIAPWDCDHSFGRDGDGELNFDRFVDLDKSLLFRKLLTQDYYVKQLKVRWQKLNKVDILSVQGLTKRANSLSKQVEKYIDKNTKKWPTDSEHYYDEKDFNQEVQIIYDFIRMRHAMVQKYISGL